MTKSQQDRIKKLTPLVKAIKKHCLDCSAGYSNEVKLCPRNNCNLHHYRNGLNQKCDKFPRKISKRDESGAIREGGE